MRNVQTTLAVLALAAAAGCRSITLPEPAATPAEAKVPALHVREVLATSGGRRLEFFTIDGKALEKLPEKAAGSVSIHAPEGAGQDNYRFDETGRVNRHMRSYGTNYAAGAWETVNMDKGGDR